MRVFAFVRESDVHDGIPVDITPGCSGNPTRGETREKAKKFAAGGRKCQFTFGKIMERRGKKGDGKKGLVTDYYVAPTNRGG